MAQEVLVTNIRRYYPEGRPVFITAVCFCREPFLQADMRKDLLLSVMREVKASSGFTMHAYVIIDNHFHWVITPRGQDFSTIMQSVKLRFTYRVKRAMGVLTPKRLWQRRFWDHVIRDADDLHRHMDYIHYNPVKHGFVSKPVDYTWSSFSACAQKGNYTTNWGAGVVPEAIDGMDLE